jgi:hypothetical protein
LVLKGDAFGDARRFDFRSDAAERLILMLQIMVNICQMSKCNFSESNHLTTESIWAQRNKWLQQPNQLTSALHN